MLAFGARTRRILDYHRKLAQANSKFIEDRLSGGSVWRLFLISAVSLFFELALIRWHAVTFQFFSFYKNITLLACFLGFGIGFARSRRRPLAIGWVIPALLAQWLLFFLINRYLPSVVETNPIVDDLTMGFMPTQLLAMRVLGLCFATLVFVMGALSSLPLGQLTGFAMEGLPRLRAYGVNLVGSLAGILAFYGLSALWAGPTTWWTVTILALVPFLASPRRMLAASLAGGALFCLAVGGLGPRSRYSEIIFSPYQPVEISHIESPYPTTVLNISGFYYQKILDLSPASLRRFPALTTAVRHYDAPYRIKLTPARVLVVGSGTGNDVAAALRGGAGHVDAIDIDPVIVDVGRSRHPERPYSDPRVSVHIEDARAFLRRTTAKYDLVVFGLLDSHSALSSLSSVRLDSYVYTLEAFRDARRVLAPDGILTLSFALAEPALAKKLALMLETTFEGQAPFSFPTGYDASLMFVSGPGRNAPHLDRLRQVNPTAEFTRFEGTVDPSTDDWPFFYMVRRSLPGSYLIILLILALTSLSMIAGLTRGMPADSSSWACNFMFFFLGAGFMLIETRAISELGLTFGTSWVIVAVVITGILVMAFLANGLVALVGGVKSYVGFPLIGAALLLGWGFSATLQKAPGFLSPLLVVALTVLPLLFAGLVFSSEFARASSLPKAMAFNLFGSICGGLLEYLSMLIGIRQLYWVSLFLYALAFLCSVAASRQRLAVVSGDDGAPRLA